MMIISEIFGCFRKSFQLLHVRNIMEITDIPIYVFFTGAVKLSSDCPEEKRVAEYLFVKSMFGFIFWGMLLLLGCKKELTKAMDNRFVEVYLVIESLFSLIWLIIGKLFLF